MYEVTLIPGDGIGPEITESTIKVIEATGVNIRWHLVNAGLNVYEDTGVLVPDDLHKSLHKNKIALKGPITTPIGSGFRSINVMLRKKYDLYANIRPVKYIEGINSPYKNVDLVIFRENTEGLYAGVEEKINEEQYNSIKIITKKASTRIIRSAFQYACDHNKKKVTVAHKANILKLSDGLFLNTAREISKEYPNITLEEIIIDNMCMQLVLDPSQFEVIVTMNLYGDILSDLCAGLVGGLGIVPGANLGDNMAIFEAVHGSAPDIAGKNIANPTALILSGSMMLDYLGEKKKAKLIIDAVRKVIGNKRWVTADLGGSATTLEYTNALIDFIK
ncbi:MAG: isocitrate/isopropylmalate dehydrogenase family protein [Anaeromicrobium sp.]|jgi:isocitrate dehydrogenase (NAD+)|uniref:isocitrate/isopropylmalate dehydrogenase family protein n=1 Tax=Anaeromicrobium sp. TaxID=1929132 RepID=UPI0025EE4FEC|nr:isocitrate/isopropylmalate dehydrogenase family protein [Anaeromicrobium sp.]MCT4595779.1 isocitrate/isopropylmalate dehydrogenase family protein [Anaeromicrobium sp.]